MHRKVGRAAAVLLAGVIGTIGPGLTPLAAAQQQPSQGLSQAGAEPPPPNVNVRPDGNGGNPLGTFEKGTKCVTRDLDAAATLQEAPWGQQYLRINKVHELMNATVGSAGKTRGGEPITVAVIDTGVNATHPYFQNRVVPGGDYVRVVPEKGAGLEDCDGHGTQVAGIIAANTPPQYGFTGVAPDAKIYSIRQTSQNYKPAEESSASQPPPAEGGEGGQEQGQPAPGGGEGELPAEGGDQPNALRAPGHADATAPAQDGGSRQQGQGAGDIESLANAIVFAADSGAIDVMNISINNCRPAAMGTISPQERELQAAIDYAVNDKNIVVVSAAGNRDDKNCKQNSQSDPSKPQTIVTPPWFADNVLSVAAVDKNGSVAPFSVHGPWVSVAAPGTEIISLDPAANSDRLVNQMIEGGGKATRIQGTSFAAPYVTGLAALVRAKYPQLNAHQVMNRITSTAQHPAAPGGRDQYVGYGMINPMAALTATVPEEEGQPPPRAEMVQTPLPPANGKNWTAISVALGGAGGAVVALLITLFTVHTIRRNRTEQS